ncbi:uncharacterized protein LOC134195428 [Corticium candelabrum]|uniref:uncharacterized protein LOC134195428 n=1 Tax=Corticium candelabrum TaxID=121492 RepID=UPI002E25575D|nr:uncharacterized protein LOC134195428 [Corticium candelabrum]
MKLIRVHSDGKWVSLLQNLHTPGCVTAPTQITHLTESANELSDSVFPVSLSLFLDLPVLQQKHQATQANLVLELEPRMSHQQQERLPYPQGVSHIQGSPAYPQGAPVSQGGPPYPPAGHAYPQGSPYPPGGNVYPQGSPYPPGGNFYPQGSPYPPGGNIYPQGPALAQGGFSQQQYQNPVVYTERTVLYQPHAVAGQRNYGARDDEFQNKRQDGDQDSGGGACCAALCAVLCCCLLLDDNNSEESGNTVIVAVSDDSDDI